MHNTSCNFNLTEMITPQTQEYIKFSPGENFWPLLVIA